jgi:hypothetical protein
MLAYRSVRDSSVIAALQERSVRSVSLHDDRKRLPRRHRPHLGKGETTVNATRYLPFAGRLLIGLAFAVSGLSKLAAYGATVDLIASSKLPLPLPLAYAGAVVVELGCGVAA